VEVLLDGRLRAAGEAYCGAPAGAQLKSTRYLLLSKNYPYKLAITKEGCRALFFAKTLGASYGKTLMLGRLNLLASEKNIREDIALFGGAGKRPEEVKFTDEYSEPLFEILGATQVDSMDFSDYEKAGIIHDLNRPIPAHLKGQYTAIVDGGTLEHVFNFPTAIRNCMEMLQPGGYFIGISPANNAMGHGFYQFSPELFYNLFRSEYGFEVQRMLIYTETESDAYPDWYEVADPSKVKSRIMLVNGLSTQLVVIAKKTREAALPDPITAQQSDYVMRWDIEKTVRGEEAGLQEPRIMRLYRRHTPVLVKKLIHAVIGPLIRRKVSDKSLGTFNPAHFKKIKF
jgi:hypothetical protein